MLWVLKRTVSLPSLLDGSFEYPKPTRMFRTNALMLFGHAFEKNNCNVRELG